jgi:electron transfer flavoprotein beta subunit
MKVLVCISHVPDTTSKINFKNDNTEFDKEGLSFVINPNDEFGLTKAMFLKEQNGAEVTVVNVGDASTEPTLRKALAIGADKAVRVNAEPTDSFMVASELAEVAKSGDYDLIICGTESIDYNGNQVHGMLAAMLELPFVYSCVGMEIEGSKAKMNREIDGGKEAVEAELPLVIAGKKGLVEEKDLRIPNMRGIMMARSKPLEVVEPKGANVQTVHESYEKPAPRGNVKMFDAEDVEGLVQALHNEAKVI